LKLVKSHAVTVPECVEFERISRLCVEKIEKAINYLKWKKEKFRLNRCKCVNVNEIDKLFGQSNIKYGIQVKLNSFLIWKYTVRWNVYAEIALLSGRVVFEHLRSRKNRIRLEVFFDLMQNSILKNNFEMNKLYLLNHDNLKMLMQFIRKKRRRGERGEIISFEQENELWEEEVSRNWKNRRKKNLIR
jgi:hypothetical protein